MNLVHIADRLYGRPLLITPQKAEILVAVLGPRTGLDVRGDLLTSALTKADEQLDPQASRFVGKRSESGGYRVEKGVAIVPVIGTLVNRGAWVGAQSGMTSYEGITHQLKTAAKDPDVRGILLDMDTPGGEAGGCFEVPALIREIRKSKPVVAFVNDLACSAGYAIASAAHSIYLTETSVVGSIGVVVVHFDRSGQMQQDGIKPTIIIAGARKADGNPFGPLPPDVKARIEGEIGAVRDLFVEHVVAGRPKLTAQQIVDLEAGVVMGAEAVRIGLADGVTTLDRCLAAVTSQLGRLPAPSPYPKETTTMTDTPAAAAEAPQSAPASPDALAAARAEGVSQGAAAERERMLSILRCEHAAGNMAQAIELAAEPSMTAESAGKILAKAPKPAKQGANAAALYTAIAAQGGAPNVGQSASDTTSPAARQTAFFERFKAKHNPNHKGAA